MSAVPAKPMTSPTSVRRSIECARRPRVANSAIHRAADALRIAAWFDAGEWRRAGAVALETSGRGEVLIVAHGAETWVLRHYRRGGMIARFLGDSP